MKKLVLLLLLTTVPHFAWANAEFQIFVNYRGFDKYDAKIVSTPQMPVSAWFVLHFSKNAVCFKGDRDEALQLMQTMTAIYNAEYNDGLSVVGSILGNGLSFEVVDSDGTSSVWFKFMRECIRWSTPGERNP